MEYVTLNNDVKMPILGLGIMKMEDIEHGVISAIDHGYRLFDTAASYENEAALGRALKNSPVKREELFITSKVKIQKNGYQGTLDFFERTLDNLGLDYLDLYLIHHPLGDVFGEWRAMEELYKLKKVRAIGVANFEPFQLVNLMMYSDTIPAINQIEIHPRYQEETQQLFNEEHHIQTESWSPFLSGKEDIFTEPVIQKIAAKHRKSAAQIVLRWIIQRGIVVIPKANSVDHMIENADIFDFQLDDDDFKEFKNLDYGRPSFFNHLNAKDVESMINLVGK
ncbi:aldo/keto reductase [Leuconostoc gasicomitatum]|uniref:Aldo/keto reductase n=1 Tax=Leuconostoc gasicomitatum TaxID=115778 RepID=A0A9Q3SZ80_9LACO|nr:aldo/keto reductase [Leuconostoc gasicomitatum]MBZ5962898.1 aldo/keto reductase [Leuconostoc gasicomitatum]